jgi:prepilin-type processing-associated H-X9-DG protein
MIAYLAILAATIPQSPATVDDVFLTESNAVFLLPPQAVCDQAESFAWSPDGTYLLVRREVVDMKGLLGRVARGEGVQRPEGSREVVIYAAKSGRLETPLRLPLDASILDVRWISGSSKSLVVTNEPNAEDPASRHYVVYWLTADGRSRQILTSRDGNVVIAASPRSAQAVISHLVVERKPSETTRPQYRSQVQLIDAEGKPLRRWEVEGGLHYLSFDGSGRLLTQSYRNQDGKLLLEWFELNPATGERGGSPVLPVDAVSNIPYELTPIRLKGADDEARSSRGIVISQSQKRESTAVVSSDSTFGEVAPDGSAVAYLHKGVVMIRPLMTMPRDFYFAQRQAAEKAVALSNAKQVALALILYASDNDDVLPEGGNWSSDLMPYLKNGDIMGGFVFTFTGGSLTGVKEPASTVLGYMPGPGGNAVAYCDGHVRWIPGDPPKG